ncbi:hypothetical protein KAU11_07350 [Candidatus Babeliales bacterium]|nr:hypothetical protein [Candidatus Babeliales bacterium]
MEELEPGDRVILKDYKGTGLSRHHEGEIFTIVYNDGSGLEVIGHNREAFGYYKRFTYANQIYLGGE